MEITNSARDFYDLAYMLSRSSRFDLESIRNYTLMTIYLEKDDRLKEKFLGSDAYIDFKIYQKKARQGKLEEFVDIFDDDKKRASSKKRLYSVYNSLVDSKDVFERILVNKKLEKYFPLEKIQKYIEARRQLQNL